MTSIGLLSFSRIVDDPRVRRQGDAFHAAGWKVWGVGLPGGRSSNPAWHVVGNEDRSLSPAVDAIVGQAAIAPGGRLGQFWREHVPLPVRTAAQPTIKAVHRAVMASRYLRAQVSLGSALQAYWRMPYFLALYERARSIRPDIWISNDWNTLPIAARLAEETGVPFGYDTHEFATGEYEERRIWRILQKPMIALIEGGLIRQARIVSSVSPSISEALHKMYELPNLPLTIFNAPIYETTEFRPAKEPARVLYHGVVSRGRGLEAAIESVADWRDRRTLTIRGPSEPQYLASLEDLIARHGLCDRVTLEAPVPMTELVAAAREFDIGILALPNHSRHNAFALPNKFFEYTMAGLALCISDLPEMANLTKKFKLGVVIDDVNPDAIARAVNDMEIDHIDQFKRNAIAASSELSWDCAAHTLVTIYAKQVAPQL